MVVRRAGTADAAALAGLRWSWRVDEGGETGLERAEFDEAFAAWAFGHRDTHLAWLAEREGHPVGMAWLAILERIPGPGMWKRLSGSLQSVYVRPGERGAGVGAALVAAVIDEAATRGLDYLVVHPSERSFTLYRRAGFVEYPGALELRLPRR